MPPTGTNGEDVLELLRVDDEVYDMYRRTAGTFEGLFCEAWGKVARIAATVFLSSSSSGDSGESLLFSPVGDLFRNSAISADAGRGGSSAIGLGRFGEGVPVQRLVGRRAGNLSFRSWFGRMLQHLAPSTGAAGDIGDVLSRLGQTHSFPSPFRLIFCNIEIGHTKYMYRWTFHHKMQHF